MKTSRFAALILCFIMLFLSACEAKSSTSSLPTPSASDVQNNGTKQFSLLYFSGDSVNPYTSTTLINRQLSSLLYDPLVRLTPDFQPEYVLAESLETAGKNCTVTIKDTLFSDGSSVTAEDVVYSYDLAKNSTTSYATELGEITSFKADGEKTVLITASKADPYIANILCFPIIKKDSDTLTDQNKIVLPPIGSGRYVPDFENLKLNANSSHVLGAPAVSVINLINTPDKAVADYNLENGNVSIFSTDLSDGVIPPAVGTASTFSLNRLVYLGVNMNDSNLKDENLRYALSAVIDRNAVCSNAYYSYAKPAEGIFDPVWEDANGLQNISSSADTQFIVAYLENLGYNSKDEEGFAVNSKGKRLSFTLVYYKGNERRAQAASMIAEQLSTVGIEIVSKELDWDDYVSALENGRFDLYVAEVKLLNNMDITELVTPGASLAYGIPKPKEPDETDGTGDKTESAAENTETDAATEQVFRTSAAVEGFYGEELSLIDIINAFNAEMPLIPICHPLGLTVCDPKINVNNVSSANDAYFGISNIR